MFEINQNYELIASRYLFSAIAKKAKEFRKRNQDRDM